jgi:hypothetical protein
MVWIDFPVLSRHGMNQQIEDFGVPYRLDPLPEPDVLIKGGEVFTFGDTTIEWIFERIIEL